MIAEGSGALTSEWRQRYFPVRFLFLVPFCFSWTLGLNMQKHDKSALTDYEIAACFRLNKKEYCLPHFYENPASYKNLWGWNWPKYYHQYLKRTALGRNAVKELFLPGDTLFTQNQNELSNLVGVYCIVLTQKSVLEHISVACTVWFSYIATYTSWLLCFVNKEILRAFSCSHRPPKKNLVYAQSQLKGS